MGSNWYLSFDCATKSLAISFVYYDRQAMLANMRGYEAGDVDLQEYMRISRESFRYVFGRVVDLFPGRPNASVTTIERIRAVRSLLDTVMLEVHQYATRVNVICEYQMAVNHKSRTVEVAILSMLAGHELHTVTPSLKNKLSFGKFTHADFLDAYPDRYKANKKHAEYNFIYLLQAMGITTELSYTKKNRSDLADSFMQIIAFVNSA